MLLRLVEGVRDRSVGAFRLPLFRTGRALRQLPFVFEQVLEEEIAPFRGRLRPRDLRAAGNGVGADTGAVLALPAETLVFNGAAFRLRTDQRRITCGVGVAEGITARE